MEEQNRMMNRLSKEDKRLQILTYFCLALSLVSTITYMIYAILTSNSILDQMLSIISVIILAIFSILYVIVGMFAQNKKVKIFLIIGSLLLSFYSIFQIIVGSTSPKDVVLDFTGQDIKDVVAWAEERDILIEQEFQNSETVSQYKVISQDVKEGTSTKNLTKIKVIVSDGVDLSVNTEVTSMVGWNLDDVIAYIDENHLTNVSIHFEFSETISKDVIISQDIISEMKRDDPITLTSSLGKESELKNITMANLVGLDTFHAIVYLGRNYLNYKIEYAYSEEQEEGIVLKQNIKNWEVVNPKDQEEIVITIARKNEMTVPDFTKMTATEITTWATNNRLKIEFSEEYDDSIKKGKVISSNYQAGSTIMVGDTIEIVLSKGQLYMIKFTTIDEFKDWAKENDVAYTVEYQFNTTVAEGNLISSSHKENQIIKNNDTIKLVISQGGSTIIPNLIGMTKETAESSCTRANIVCKFAYKDNDTGYSIVTKQSMRNGSNVPINTTIIVTLGE